MNSRDNIRAALDKQESFLDTTPRLSLWDTAVRCDVQVTTETSPDNAVSKALPPGQVSSYSSFSGSIALNKEKYPASPVPAILTGRDE